MTVPILVLSLPSSRRGLYGNAHARGREYAAYVQGVVQLGRVCKFSESAHEQYRRARSESYRHGDSHAGYYGGGQTALLKLLYIRLNAGRKQYKYRAYLRKCVQHVHLNLRRIYYARKPRDSKMTEYRRPYKQTGDDHSDYLRDPQSAGDKSAQLSCEQYYRKVEGDVYYFKSIFHPLFRLPPHVRRRSADTRSAALMTADNFQTKIL